MACLRLTVLRVRPGMKLEAQELLEDLDESLSGSEGLLMSFVTQMEGERLGRISLWHSKDAANHEATRDHVLAIRARLRHMAAETQELLMEVKSGHVPEELAEMLSGELHVDSLPRTVGTEAA